ncbi:CehA/McbA family metallohydrolase [Streptacidiphilus carbonis]|uniref:CehA/McbA family metallohydrolase n=1 Tax=Streptacidiphilus carbonis TaxID=105422 RepID=UPI0005A60AF0|nr:CehA/McbA family metallohydrolase [Streptacidiphilus carbonis]
MPRSSWYRGDCHVHSVLSTAGELTPQQLAAAARAAGLDFIATTEHNTAEGHGAWAAHAGPDLLVILGQEATTQTGHWLALGIGPGQSVDWDYGVQDHLVDEQVDRVHGVGGLCVAAHPHAPYPTGDFAYPLQGFDVVEVWNGQWASDRPWNADNERALAEWAAALTAADLRDGSWRPAMGNSDTHLAGQLSLPHTVVLAEELSTRAILAGIRAGRSWIAESAAVGLSLTATAAGHGAGIGERLNSLGEPVNVRADIRGVPWATVSFHTDHGGVHRAPELPAHGAGAAQWHTTARESGFVRVEVRHPNGHMAALTNPVVLT